MKKTTNPVTRHVKNRLINEKKCVLVILSCVILIVISLVSFLMIIQPSDFVLMVYVVGSDLESSYSIATSEIRSMMKVGSGNGVDVIVQAGGSNKWRMTQIEEGKLNTLYIKKQKAVPLQVEENKNMSDPNVLTNFIIDTVEKYPADHYGIVLWNHGSGSVYGFGNDELYQYESMSVAEIESAFKNAKVQTNVEFEFIGFDCCLMSNLETAASLSPYAKYMIASEELEPGCGYDYESLISSLRENPKMSGIEIGNLIIDKFIEQLDGFTEAQHLTLSLIDLKKVKNVEEKLEQWINNQELDYASISRARSFSQSYGGRTTYEGLSDLIDIGSFIQQFPDNAFTDDVISAIQEAIIRVHYGSARTGTTGFSVYFPYYGVNDFDSRQKLYNTVNAMPEYKKFTVAFSEWINETNIDISFDAPTSITEDGEFNVVLKEEDLPNIKTVNCILGIVQDDDTILGLGFDNDVSFDRKTNTLSNNSTGMWLGINNHLVATTITEETYDYNLYSIPILLNGKEVSVQGAWYWDDSLDAGGYYEILGVWAGINETTGTVERNYINVKRNDSITCLYNVKDEESGKDIYIEGETFTVEDELTLDDVVIPPNQYVYAFEIVDVANKSYRSNYVPITWTKEKYEQLYNEIYNKE